MTVAGFNGRSLGRIVLAFIAGVLATAAVASVLQTQINLAAITGLGVAVPAGARAATTAEDLLRFGPVMAAITAAAFLPAFLIGGLVARAAPGLQAVVLAVAGALGLAAAFGAMGWFTPMPTLIAAVRSTAGLIAMSATGLIGGTAFALLRPRAPAGHPA
jgi:hypothetical protein